MEEFEFKPIGYRKNGIGYVYIFILILGIALFVGGILLVVCDAVYESLMFFLCSILAVGYSIVEMKEFYSTKPYVITANEEKMKVNDSVFAIKDIVDVSYKNARSRHCIYKYGTITIKTVDYCYTAQFVAECEMVSKKITQLMYEKKSK